MLVLVAQTILSWNGLGKIRFFYGDETRLGLKTLDLLRDREMWV